MSEKPQEPSQLDLISYAIAAAIMAPIGWYLKAHYAQDFGAWLLSPFH